MRFIEVHLAGGLGNQLFQYATARALMKKSDFLFFNINSYKEDYVGRSFKLFNYNIKGSIISNKWMQKIFAPNTKFNKIIEYLGLYSLITEKDFFIHYDLVNKTKFITSTIGFWQSENYFKSIRDELLNEINLNYKIVLPEIFNLPNTVAVHIRRNDYLTDPRYGFIGELYYRNAIYLLRQKLETPLFIIFSDDLVWCRSIFSDEKFHFFDDAIWTEDYQQLYLMSKCSHQIIANSSFSWWSAWLNQYSNKIIIRPAKPFNDPDLLYENYYPFDWIAL